MAAWIEVEGTVQPGHQIASGLAADTPYGAGSITLQAPFFERHGLSLAPYFSGTINLSIAPKTFQVKQPLWQFWHLRWTHLHPPETFSFCQAQVGFRGQIYRGLVYYPHPETKQAHFQAASILELLAPKIEGLRYGDRLSLWLDPTEIEILEPDC